MLKRLLKQLFVLSTFFSTGLSALVINTDDPYGTSLETVVGVIQSQSNLSTFAEILMASGISQELEGEGPFTIFVPSNTAFSSLSNDAIKNFSKKENLTKIQNFIKNHVVLGSVTTSSMKNGNIKTLGNKFINIQLRGAQVQVDGANVIDSDLQAANGVVQVIDSVVIKS